MGGHAAPAGWLQRWQDAEPVRLYLWSVASAVIATGTLAGWLTAELSVAVAAMASAVLMVGGAAAARRHAYAPATVDQLLDAAARKAEEVAAAEYARGLQQGSMRTPEQVARELGRWPDSGDLEETTAAPRVQLDDTVSMVALRGCPYMTEDGRRCLLSQHPRGVEHELPAPPGR